MLENPLRSLAWRQEPLQATLGMSGVGTAVTDACVWKKRRPDTGELVRKPTMVVGTPAVVAAIDVRCAGDHDHGVIEGAVHYPCGSNRWKKMAVSDWAGGYTAEFCKALLQGVQTVVSEEKTVPPGRQTVIRDEWKNQNNAHRVIEASWVGKTCFEASDGTWREVTHDRPRRALMTPMGVAVLQLPSGVSWTGARETSVTFINEAKHCNFPTSNHPEPEGVPTALGPARIAEQVAGAVSSQVRDEDTMHPAIDEGSGSEHPYWSDMEIPEHCRREIKSKTTRKMRRAVRKAHRGLGHPSREVFVKMLRLGQAQKAAIDYAKTWQCPVCAASQMPGAPHPATATLRPCGFNETVVADLKYVKDSKGKTWVALSMVDAGTCWHVAVLLRNRKPRHVGRQLIEGWIRHYGCPRYLIVDQGGEFEGNFNETCDELGIDASVTASHAAWQHGLAERHGGLLGTFF